MDDEACKHASGPGDDCFEVAGRHERPEDREIDAECENAHGKVARELDVAAGRRDEPCEPVPSAPDARGKGPCHVRGLLCYDADPVPGRC